MKDAYRVNCYVRGADGDTTAEEALGGFERFPTWMWRNAEVRDFVDWLRAYNLAQPAGAPRAGFYGLDLYSLHTSIHAVLGYLQRVDPAAAARARERYACFEHFGEDSQAYGRAVAFGLERSCEDEAVRQLVELRARAAEYAARDGRVAEDEYFHAEQNARLAQNAEHYYRSMFEEHTSSWNLRDRHMAESLDALAAHLDRQMDRARIVVWEHNSHVGDARATEMGERGQLTVGQLARARYGRDAVLVGQTTYTGTVTAADNWDDPPRRMRVRPALAESYEALFHRLGIPRFLVSLREGSNAEALRARRLERAIGVIYRPRTERPSHYFSAALAEQFDAVLHLDETQALVPLDPGTLWQTGEEAPETYPFAL